MNCDTLQLTCRGKKKADYKYIQIFNLQKSQSFIYKVEKNTTWGNVYSVFHYNYTFIYFLKLNFYDITIPYFTVT